jgi:membrane fusion protein, copper/silver efflux system
MKKPSSPGLLVILALVAFAASRYIHGSNHDNHPSSKHVLYYVDPMHPAYRSDKAGIAPDCGMPLVPVYEGEDSALKLQLPPGAVYVDPEKQRLIGVHVEAVEKNSGARLVRTTGRVEADGNRMHRLMAGCSPSGTTLMGHL